MIFKSLQTFRKQTSTPRAAETHPSSLPSHVFNTCLLNTKLSSYFCIQATSHSGRSITFFSVKPRRFSSFLWESRPGNLSTTEQPPRPEVVFCGQAPANKEGSADPMAGFTEMPRRAGVSGEGLCGPQTSTTNCSPGTPGRGSKIPHAAGQLSPCTAVRTRHSPKQK